MPPTSPYDISAKLSKHRQFADGYISTLLDADQSEIESTIEHDYTEIEPRDLPAMPVGSRIIYTRRDTGKMVVGVVIVRHALAADSRPATFVAYPAGRTISLGPRAIAAGKVRAPMYGNQWCIKVIDVATLFVSRFVTDSSRIDVLERRLDVAENVAHEAIKVIGQLLDRVAGLDAQVAAATQPIAELQDHVGKQRELLKKLIMALPKSPAGPARLPAIPVQESSTAPPSSAGWALVNSPSQQSAGVCRDQRA